MTRTNKVLALLLTVISLMNEISSQRLVELKQLAEWKEMEFEFPSPNDRENAILNNNYISGNSVPIDVDIDYRAHAPSRVFVTIPRFSVGVPITLGLLTSTYGPSGPQIQAYPNYSWQSGRNCEGFTSVFRVAIDECRRLWVVDTGRVGDNQLCPPQIVVFDLNTDLVIHRYKFPANLYKPGVSLFITPIVDVRDPGPIGTCANTMVYIADVNGYGVIVYDFRRNVAWRTQNKYFYPTPDNGTFTIRGESFDLMDGVFGMALSQKDRNPRAFNIHHTHNTSPQQSYPSDRHLFFHSLASNNENRVTLSVLDNQTAWTQNPDYSPRSFVKIGSRISQSAAQAMDSNGNLFFGLMDPIAVACWDSSKPYTRHNMRLVAQNDEKLQFASGMKVVLNKKGKEELWVVTCRFQKVMTGSINSNEVNFRIQAIQIDELLGGTQCTRGGVALGESISFPYN